MSAGVSAGVSLFIDGGEGTTALELRARLSRAGGLVEQRGVRMLEIPPTLRKDAAARQTLLAQADVAVLCLPDAAAREAVELVGDAPVRILDASSAHRSDPAWVYGMPEWDTHHDRRIARARRVSNPGCYAVAAVALLRPLVAGGALAPDAPVSIHAISGYSGGGRSLIARYQNPDDLPFTAHSWHLYGLGLDHKHVPEIAAHAGLTRRPLFVPSVGGFFRGQVVHIPLRREWLSGAPGAADLHETLRAFYARAQDAPEKRITVFEPDETARIGRLFADRQASRDSLEIHVLASEPDGFFVLVAVLDNLGFGAAGSAEVNLGLMLADVARTRQHTEQAA